MQLLYYLESIRTPFWDAVMSAVTHLGEEAMFLLAVVTVFWCISKRNGYYLLLIGLTGTVLNQTLKITCCIPRPWVQDPNFTIVESAREQAIGYSFPSGHSQNVVGTFGGIARFTRYKWLRRGLCILALIVCFSRMYLGVHTLLDVGVSFLIAVALVLTLYPLMEKTKQKPDILDWLLLGSAILCGLYLLYLRVVVAPCPPEDVKYSNYSTAVESGLKLLGATIGLTIAHWLDRRYVHFDTEAVWWVQVLKVAIGLGLLLAVKSVLKSPLQTLLPGCGDAIRYGVVAIVAGVGWPASFRWWRKWGQKK